MIIITYYNQIISQYPESEEVEGGIAEEVAYPAAKRPRRFIRMAEYEVTKMEGVDETDPEISFKVRVPSHALLFHGSVQGD